MKHQDAEIAEFIEISDDLKEKRAAPIQPPLTVDVVRSSRELAALKKEWDALVEQADVTVFQTFDWLSLWWKHFGAGGPRSLHILVFRIDRKVVGIAPFFIESQSFFGFRVRRWLKLMGCETMPGEGKALVASGGPSDYLGIIVAPRYESEVVTLLARYIEDHTHLFDAMAWSHIPEDGILWNHTVPMLEKMGFKVRFQESDICPRLRVRSSFDEYLHSLDTETRNRFQRAKRNFASEPMHAIETIGLSEQLDSAFLDLISLHQHRWRRMGYLGLFADERFDSFQREVADAFLANGWLWFKTAQIAGICVGARLGFIFKDRLYDYLSGFDDRPPWSKSRPGLALLGAMIEDAATSNREWVDLLRGGEEYKFKLAGEVRYNRSVSLFSPTSDRRVGFHLANALNTLQDYIRRMQKEWLFIQVQVQGHGTLTAFWWYFAFLWKRLFQRLKGQIATESSTPVHKDRKEAGIVAKLSSRGELLRSSLPRLSKRIEHAQIRLSAPFYLWRCSLIGKRARTKGRPVIQNRGRIKIGNDLFMNSTTVPTKLITGPSGHIEIGNEVSLGVGTSIQAQDLVKIHNRVKIGNAVTILDTDEDLPEHWYASMTAEPVILEDDVKVEHNVTILKGVRIGRGSVLKEGSIVSQSIPPYVIAKGIPARVIGHIVKPSEASPQSEATNGLNRSPGAIVHQNKVSAHFQSTAQYWQEVYGARDLEGVIYQRRLATVLALIDELFLPPDASVLEVGCGAGLVAVALARRGFNVEAIDEAEAMVKETSQRVKETGFGNRITVRREDVHNLSLEDGKFDLVVAVGVLPWLHAPENGLKEMARVTKKGGYILVTADNKWRLNHTLDPRYSELFAPMREQVKSALAKLHLYRQPSDPSLVRMHSAKHIDNSLSPSGVEKVKSFTVGFGPFTLWGKKIFSERAGIHLHGLLQSLGDRGVPIIRSVGSHYLVLARKQHIKKA